LNEKEQSEVIDVENEELQIAMKNYEVVSKDVLKSWTKRSSMVGKKFSSYKFPSKIYLVDRDHLKRTELSYNSTKILFSTMNKLFDNDIVGNNVDEIKTVVWIEYGTKKVCTYIYDNNMEVDGSLEYCDIGIIDLQSKKIVSFKRIISDEKPPKTITAEFLSAEFYSGWLGKLDRNLVSDYILSFR
jgi:hypothetical protein